MRGGKNPPKTYVFENYTVVLADGVLSKPVITTNIQNVEAHEKLSSVYLTPVHPHSFLGKILKAFLVDRFEKEHDSAPEGNIPNRVPSTTPEGRCHCVIFGPVHKLCGLGSPLIFRHDYDGQTGARK